MRRSIKAAIVRDGAVLLVSETGERWMFPGGKPEEQDTSDQATMRRELWEEIGCKLSPTVWQKLGSVPALSERHGIPTEYVFYIVEIIGTPKADQEIGYCDWFDKPDSLTKGYATSEAIKMLRQKGLMSWPKPPIVTQFPH